MASQLVYLSRSLRIPWVESKLPGVTFLHCTQVEVADRAVEFERIWAGERFALDRNGFLALLRRRVEEGHLDEEARWLFLRTGGELVGVALAAPETPSGRPWTPSNSSADTGEPVGRIRWLAVERSARRRGFGRALLRRAMAISHQRGLERCLAAVRRDNEAALAFLGSEGFTLGSSGNG